MGFKGKGTLVMGQKIEVTIEKVAHGGHFIARHEGAVIFIRHAIPGEKVLITITSVGASFLRADVVEVLEPSDDRVQPPCDFAYAGGCGGCDFQHISVERQLRLKSQVITEQFSRIAKMDIDIDVESIGEPTHWRSRVTATSDAQGRLGFIASRSHSVIPITDCTIAVPQIQMNELTKRMWPASSRIEISTSSQGERVISIGSTEIIEGDPILHEEVGDKVLQVHHQSFWQGHRIAPKTLTEVVKNMAGVKEGDHVLDLYGGVGLFTAALVDEIGQSGLIELVEGSTFATKDAQVNFASYPQVKVHNGNVQRVVRFIDSADVVVLDPPREGAGKEIILRLGEIGSRTIVYVACDPAALARDTTYLIDSGYQLQQMRAFDLFPMTHHIEIVAQFTRNDVS
ncbi:unannotated protein [freshwater metagenome]|uniref:Unannotated protein n=1 Tax=freshwater metagenome TaxID=449393 RepID=A0A6J7XS56_9ZZZZ|nr:TRAM domain-containing protein [Actinomycetota bacterium]